MGGWDTQCDVEGGEYEKFIAFHWSSMSHDHQIWGKKEIKEIPKVPSFNKSNVNTQDRQIERKLTFSLSLRNFMKAMGLGGLLA